MGYDYTKVQEYLLMLARHINDHDMKDQLQQQSLAYQQQILQLQQQLDTERKMKRSMALQLDKLQESSYDTKSHSDTPTGNLLKYYLT